MKQSLDYLNKSSAVHECYSGEGMIQNINNEKGEK